MLIVIFIVIIFLAALFAGAFLIKARQKGKYAKAISFYKNERYEEALNIFQELSTRNTKNRVYLWNIGVCYEKLGKYEMALVELNKLSASTSFGPKLSEVEIRHKIALINLKLNNTNKAWNEFQIVISLDPEHTDSYYNLGIIATGRSDLRKAAEYFDKACRYNEEFPEAWLELGKVNFKMGHHEEAKKALVTAIKQKPEMIEARFYQAIILEKERSFQKSLEEFDHALGDERYRFISFVHIGNIYMSLNNSEMAFDSFEKALRIGTTDIKELVEAKYQYAGFLIGSGNINKAMQLWKDIDTVHPNYKDVRNKINIYQEINKSTNLTRFITLGKDELLEVSRSLCSLLKVNIESCLAEKKDFVEFIGTFSVGRDEHSCVVNIAKWINQVGEIPVRDLLERMSSYGASKGIFITSSNFTQKALDLSNIRPIELIDKERLEKMLEKVFNT